MKVPWTIICGSVGILLGMVGPLLLGWKPRTGWWFVVPAVVFGLAVDILIRRRRFP